MNLSRSFRDRHFHVHAYLPVQVKDLLDKVLASRGLSFTSWINGCIERDVSERLPESQGGVKKIIPADVAEAAREVLEQQGDFLYRLGEKTADPTLKNDRMQRAGRCYDVAAFFGDIEGEIYRRKHILESGQRQRRHRRKAEASPGPAINSRPNT